MQLANCSLQLAACDLQHSPQLKQTRRVLQSSRRLHYPPHLTGHLEDHPDNDDSVAVVSNYLGAAAVNGISSLFPRLVQPSCKSLLRQPTAQLAPPSQTFHTSFSSPNSALLMRDACFVNTTQPQFPRSHPPNPLPTSLHREWQTTMLGRHRLETLPP